MTEKALPQATTPVQAGTSNYSAVFLFAGGLLALAAYFIYDLARDKIK
jgi:hypothetical protein